MRATPRRAIRPSAAEVARNPRAQSARLRVGDEGWLTLASASHAQAPRSPSPLAPAAQPKHVAEAARRRRSARARGGILWIAVSGILLAGVVFVNVAVLRLNLALDGANAERVEAARRERGAPVASSRARSRRRAIQAQAPRAARARRTPDPSEYGYVDLARSECARAKQANRRIRLLLAVFVARLRRRRSPAPPGCRACSAAHARADGAAPAPRDDPTIPAGRGTIFDRTGVQLAIGEQTTTVYADPQQVTRRRARSRVAAHELLGVDANQLYPQLLDKKASFVYVAALRRSRRPRLVPEEGLRRRRLLPGGAAHVPAGHASAAQVVGYAGTDNKGLGGLEVAVRQQARRAGRASRRSSATRSGRAIDVISSTPEREGSRRLHDDRPHDPGATPRRCCAQTVAQVGREGRDGDRARPDDRRGARDGAGAGLRREQRRTAVPFDAAAQPRRHRHLRARLDVQARHDRRRALRAASSRPDTTFTLPYSIHGRRPHRPRRRAARRPRRCRVAQILSHSSNVGAVTIAEKLGASRARGLDRAASASASTTGIDFPGESPGLGAAARPVVGLDDRQRADRAGHRRDADPDGVGLRARSRTAASGSQPHLVERVGGRAPGAAASGAGSSRRRSTAS